MKYFIWVLGCAMNNSDAERIATVLDLLGYTKTDKETEADLIITVACSVRQHAIDRIYGSAGKWRRLKAKNPNLKNILTGCVLEQDLPRMRKIFDIIFEIDELGKLPGLLGVVLGPEEIQKIGKSGEYLDILPAYESSFRAYVPIMTGCDNFCTYCAVPYTRGREKSRSASEIIDEVMDLVQKGYKEITLLGQNVNSYNSKVKPNTKKEDEFVNLLRKIDKIPGDYRVYFYSNHPKDMSENLITTMSTLKHFPNYLHLPLQSGNDKILRDMNRHYTKKEYLDLVEKIKKTLPDVTLTTDIMVGFPGEGEKEFADTVSVMKKAKFDMAFTAQYSPRPGTPSAKVADDVSAKKKKKREKILIGILAQTVLVSNQKLVGTTQKVLLDGFKGEKLYGRTEGYKVVELANANLLKVKDQMLGQFIDVKIKSATAWMLIGSVI